MSEKKYIIVKNNCALMEYDTCGMVAYFFTDKSDGTYYNTLKDGHLDVWTAMFKTKENAEMVLDSIKKVWASEGHMIEWNEEDETCINENPEGSEIVMVEKIEDKWVVCEENKNG